MFQKCHTLGIIHRLNVNAQMQRSGILERILAGWILFYNVMRENRNELSFKEVICFVLIDHLWWQKI